MVTVSATEEQRKAAGLTFLIQRKKLNIPISAVNGRLNYVSYSQPELLRRAVHLFDNARVFLRVANDASLSHFPTSDFKLRLNERYQPSCLSAVERSPA